ncbi:MAG: hypothetical protein IPM51_11840 [Sphingobacteriaceae bacterium]|nr:hypothetical protein [Sphingobacteriaceae bacterium]
MNNLEHEGDEFFDEEKVTNREDVTAFNRLEQEAKKLLLLGARDKLQEQWLQLDNPLLWDGEID